MSHFIEATGRCWHCGCKVRPENILCDKGAAILISLLSQRHREDGTGCTFCGAAGEEENMWFHHKVGQFSVRAHMDCAIDAMELPEEFRPKEKTMTDNDVESQLKHINQNIASMQQWIANLEEGQKAALAEMRAAAKSLGQIDRLCAEVRSLVNQSSAMKGYMDSLAATIKQKSERRGIMAKVKAARAAWRDE